MSRLCRWVRRPAQRYASVLTLLILVLLAGCDVARLDAPVPVPQTTAIATSSIPLPPAPSALPVSATVPLPTATETTIVQVFYGNERLGNASANPCRQVYPLRREVPRGSDLAGAALEQLFAGPSVAERAQGYSSWFSEHTANALKRFWTLDGTAYVDLADIRSTIPNASTSCGSGQLLSQMESTLKQFGTVRRILYAIEGQPRTFYDWLQIGCEESSDYCDDRPFK